jgi:catalase
MNTNKKPALSSRTSSKENHSVTAAGQDDVLRTNDVVAEQASASEDLIAAMSYNSGKPLEYGHDNAVAPPPGLTVKLDSITLTASTSTEEIETTKTGGAAQPGMNPLVASLDRVRVDASDRSLTTNQGVRISDNQNTLKAGLRGRRHSPKKAK